MSDVVGVESGSAYIAGKSVFPGDVRALLEDLDQLRRDGGRHLVVTCNVDQLISLSESLVARQIYDQASVVTVDGQPVRMLFRSLGVRTSRVTGADLMPAVVEAALTIFPEWKVAIVGGGDGVAAEAARRLGGGSERIVGFDAPAFAEATDSSLVPLVEHLHAFDADITFVCMGFPKQELFVLEEALALPSGVYIGAGAAVDFAAGNVRRAPLFMQFAGLEWAWRVGQEPRRLWRRYFVRGPRFVSIATESYRATRRQTRPGAVE